jgi:hypothetical protein
MKVAESNTNWRVYPEEQKLSFPCDRFIECHEDAVYYRGITIHAVPKVIFRWLCQLRVAPYSYDWIDNFGIKSPNTLTPGIDELLVGQRVMKSFKLVDFEQDRHLTVLAKKATPKSESRIEYYILSQLFGEIAISYLIVPKTASSCRLLVKLIVRYPPGITGWFMRIFLPWGDKIMMRKQLLNFKKLSEREKNDTVQSAGVR